jgi:hypothetical protein
MRLPANPLLLEANARLLARRFGGAEGTLLGIPDERWERFAGGFDLVWLMGAWQRSDASRGEALASEELRRAYAAALPDWSDADVAGSPYAVADYTLDRALGAPGHLVRLRERLNALGLGLVLDFVPNHVARDHPWTVEEPDWCVRTTPAAAAPHPEWFFRTPADVMLAHGRDPNFGPWTDTAQLNYAAPALRAAQIDTLLRIAERADGVRCDMAMLVLNDVFGTVWGPVLGHPAMPAAEFWSTAIAAVKARFPRFLFVAEAYWGMEERLVELGFDYVYDKACYDSLRGDDVASLRAWRPGAGVGSRGVRFVENHDEERAATAFGAAKGRAAATVATTLPGLRLIHDGQREGRRARLPVQLVREPDEPVDGATAAFYARLLAAAGAPPMRDGAWAPVTVVPAGDWGNEGSVLAWSWRRGAATLVVALNYSAQPASCRLVLPAPDGAPSRALPDRLAEGAAAGQAAPALTLALTLEPWGTHVFADGADGADGEDGDGDDDGDGDGDGDGDPPPAP